MPAKAPAIGEVLSAKLQSLGERIRAQRAQQKVSATVAAEAAGMSRVTLHRIERGEPSVTMGAYLSAIDALGLQLALSDPLAHESTPGRPKLTRSPSGGRTPHGGGLGGPLHAVAPDASLPARLRLDDYPQLKRLAWQLQGVAELSPADALSLYERNWRHIDQASLLPAERTLVKALVDQLGGGRLLV